MGKGTRTQGCTSDIACLLSGTEPLYGKICYCFAIRVECFGLLESKIDDMSLMFDVGQDIVYYSIL